VPPSPPHGEERREAARLEPPLLETRELSASYGRVAALKPTSLTVAEGELVTVLGPNGAGKTTLLRAITRLISAQGKVLFKGEDVSRLATHELAARGIIMVMEGRGLFANMSVRENLILGAYTLGKSADETEKRLAEVFTLFPRLNERVEQKAPLALKLARRAYVISLGRIAAELAADQIKSHHDLARYYLH
jgi:branched-chain amino acid transport system ATP-binding protein